MPFQYQPYSSPFAGSIAQLIARRGEIAAHAAELAGQANARAAEQSGAAWANGVQNTGQILGSLPLQMAAARRAQTQDQLQQIAVTDAQQRHAGGAAVDTMMRGDQLPAGEVGPRQGSYLDANGLFDIPKMTAALGQSGMGHLAPDLLKGAESINESILKHQELEQKTAQQQTILIGDLADGALKLSKSGVPLVDAMDFAVQPALATKRIKPEDYQRIRAQIAALSPEQQTAAMNQFMDQAATLGEKKTLAEGAQEVDRYGRVLAKGGEKAPTEAALALRAANGDTAAMDAMNRLKPPTGKYEQKNVTLDGKPNQLVNYDPKTGQMFTPGSDQPIAAARLRGNTPPSIVIKNEKDVQGSENRSELATMLRTGMMSPSMLSKRGDYNEILAEANRQHKAETGKPLNLSKLQLDFEGAKRFVGSLNSNQMTRFRQLGVSVVNTIDEVNQLANQLQQGGLELWNKAKLSTVRAVYGNTPQSELANRYAIAVNTLKEEFANLANGGYAPTEAAWTLANDQIRGGLGVKDLTSSLGEVQRLINYRLNAPNELTPMGVGGPVTNTSTPPPAPSAPIKVGGFTVKVKGG